MNSRTLQQNQKNKKNLVQYGSVPCLAPPPIPIKMRKNDKHIIEKADEFDDDYDDDDEDGALDWDDYENPDNAPRDSEYANFSEDWVKKNSKSSKISKSEHASSVKTANRFSQSGGDAFLFSSPTPNSQNSNKSTFIVNSPDGIIWKSMSESFACKVTAPKKERKLLGIKTFVSYQLIPTFSNIQVSRRFRHFVWLHQRLVEKFSTIAIPPLPEKQRIEKSCRQGEDFVSCRLRLLQIWIGRMCMHPIISQSDVFQHFLTCTDEKRWTVGKRTAEKDVSIGGNYFFCIEAPPLDLKQAEHQIEKFNSFINNMEVSTRRFNNVGDHYIKSHQGYFKKEYQSIAQCFADLSKSFEIDDRPRSTALTRAYQHTGKTYNDIGELHGKQPCIDMGNMLECIQEYRGILSAFPNCIIVQKAATAKVQEKKGKMENSEMQAVESRAGVIASTVLAEIQHFHQQRIQDYKNHLKEYLLGQIKFHKEITMKLEDTLSRLDKV